MNTTAQIKQQLKKSATQIAAEPMEMLKSVKIQTGLENLPQSVSEQKQVQSNVSPNEEINKKQIAESDMRHLEALNNEILDIRRQKLFNDLLLKIQNGEDVPIQEFTELTFEQKDVLKAHLEAVKKQSDRNNMETPLTEPVTKKSRRFGETGKRKNPAEQQQTRVEKPVPPSG